MTRDERIAAAVEAGEHPAAVGHRFGLTENRVRQIWREAVVPKVVWSENGVGRVAGKEVGRVLSFPTLRGEKWESRIDGVISLHPTEKRAKAAVERSFRREWLANEGSSR